MVGFSNWLADQTTGAMRSFVESVLADEGIRERVGAHKLNSADKKAIDKAYLICFNTKLKKTCSNCYADAYFLIRNKDLTTIMKKCNYSLKNGAVIEWKGNFYNNTNLTDEVAAAFIEAFPTTKFFSVVPAVKVVENIEETMGETMEETPNAYEGMTPDEIRKAKRREADRQKKAVAEAAKLAAEGGEDLL